MKENNASRRLRKGNNFQLLKSSAFFFFLGITFETKHQQLYSIIIHYFWNNKSTVLLYILHIAKAIYLKYNNDILKYTHVIIIIYNIQYITKSCVKFLQQKKMCLKKLSTNVFLTVLL